MGRSRLHKSFADYLAIAISPVLIMLMVGSLVFFLLEVGHGGRYPSQAKWILFWFVLAIVLVARIGIEQGKAYASGYAAALGVATAFVVVKLVDSPLIVIGLLGLVWWSANKLTWDCTLIDDSVDASGHGLLQVSGIAREIEPETDAKSESAEPADEAPAAKPAGKLARWLNSTALYEDEPQQHSPGLWVVYFSIAALPIFGIGQAVFGFTAKGEDRGLFYLLFVYVAAAMGLLLTTSFLGLRRYLRQRKLQMPSSMAASWFVTGMVFLGIVMLIAVLLPRPNAQYSVTALLDKLDSKTQQASKNSQMKDSGEGKGQGGDENDPDQMAQADDEEGQGDGKENQNAGGGNRQKTEAGKRRDSDDGERQGGGQQSEDGGKGGDEDEQKTGEQAQQGGPEGPEDEQSEQDQANASSKPQNSSSSGSVISQVVSTVSQIVKWALYIVLAIVVCYLVIRNFTAIKASISQFWAQLQDFFRRLFGQREREDRAEQEALEAQAAQARRRSYAAYSNPFSSGRGASMSEHELLRYTLEALEGWSAERGWPREPEQTVLEFAQQLSHETFELTRPLLEFARLYTRFAYGSRRFPKSGRRTIEQLWREMDNSAAMPDRQKVAIS